MQHSRSKENCTRIEVPLMLEAAVHRARYVHGGWEHTENHQQEKNTRALHGENINTRNSRKLVEELPRVSSCVLLLLTD